MVVPEVVPGHHPCGAHLRHEEAQVLFDPSFAMVPIDEEEVEALLTQHGSCLPRGHGQQLHSSREVSPKPCLRSFELFGPTPTEERVDPEVEKPGLLRE